MKTFYLTDPGMVRSHNEDSVIVSKNENGEYLLAVADGMGGHKAGEVAAAIVTMYLGNAFSKIKSIGTKKEAAKWIEEAATEINNNIFKYTDEVPESKGMGSTLVICIFAKDFLIFGNIGDSSGYVLKNKKLHKVTNDHTLVNLLVTTGELTEEDAKTHPKKNVLMKALGANNPVEIDIFDVEREVDAVLLCSDGLSNMLSNDQIERTLCSKLNTDDTVIRLIQKANNRGGNDNISVAYLETGTGE